MATTRAKTRRAWTSRQRRPPAYEFVRGAATGLGSQPCPLLLEGEQVLLDYLEERCLLGFPPRVGVPGRVLCARGYLHDGGFSAGDGRWLLRLTALPSRRGDGASRSQPAPVRWI
jgi:hypothetical protein